MPDFSYRDIKEKDDRHSEKNGFHITCIGVNKREDQESIHDKIGCEVIRTTDPPDVSFEETLKEEPYPAQYPHEDKYPQKRNEERCQTERDHARQ